MEQLGIELQFCTTRTPTEEVDCATFTNHIHGPLPRLRTAHCLDHHVCSPFLGSESANRRDGIVYRRNLHTVISTEAMGVFHLLVSLNYRDNAHATQLCNLHEH